MLDIFEKRNKNIKDNNINTFDRLLNESIEKSLRNRAKYIKEIEVLNIRQQILLNKIKMLLGNSTANISQPPKTAEFILYIFIPKPERNAILGDLEEEFRDVHKKFGLRKAQIFYWCQVTRSIWPLVSDGVLKLLKLIYNGIITRLAIGK